MGKSCHVLDLSVFLIPFQIYRQPCFVTAQVADLSLAGINLKLNLADITVGHGLQISVPYAPVSTTAAILQACPQYHILIVNSLEDSVQY